MPWSAAPDVFRRADASWRRMLLAQLPTQMALVTVTRSEWWSSEGCSHQRAVPKLAALRMGTLYDLVVSFVHRNPSARFCGRRGAGGHRPGSGWEDQVRLDFGKWVHDGVELEEKEEGLVREEAEGEDDPESESEEWGDIVFISAAVCEFTLVCIALTLSSLVKYQAQKKQDGNFNIDPQSEEFGWRSGTSHRESGVRERAVKRVSEIKTCSMLLQPSGSVSEFKQANTEHGLRVSEEKCAQQVDSALLKGAQTKIIHEGPPGIPGTGNSPARSSCSGGNK
ncbi:hypothetical protein K438DRAFT_1787088 [Mycena galopus ATCC 62051]|nr:hypothetical protein K438DRAFT_1787088 [Mycena galopus ATCC 62051]